MRHIFRPIVIPLLVCTFLLTLYYSLVSGHVIPPSDGINRWQTNMIKAERYSYYPLPHNSIVLVGSSITARINAEDISSQAVNLGMVGMSSQTGLKIVEKEPVKPSILLLELNNTIQQRSQGKLNREFIEYLYNPFYHSIRTYLPILRQEYQPASILAQFLIKLITQEKKVLFRFLEEGNVNQNSINPELVETLIKQQIEQKKYPLSENSKKAIKEESSLIKTQIQNLEKAGIQVFLMDVPIEARVRDTLQERQTRELLKTLFPPNTFKWIPEPKNEKWRTNDGIHLSKSSAVKYAHFLREQLINKKLP